jgi:hypothetical protein
MLSETALRHKAAIVTRGMMLAADGARVIAA